MRNDEVMVDWLTGVVESELWLRSGYAPYDTGRTIEVSPDGVLKTLRKNWLQAEGSFSNKVQLKSVSGSDLWISGNPSKFFQGHNLFGSGKTSDLFFNLGMAVRQQGHHFPSPETFTSSEFLIPRFTRVDLTRSYRFPTQKEAAEYLRDVVANSRSRHGSAIMTGGTGYFGKNSTRWSMKVYLKKEEILSTKKGHSLSSSFSNAEKSLSGKNKKHLIDWADGVVRHELTLRSPEIEKLNYPYNTLLSNLEIFEMYYKKIEWNGNTMNLTTEMSETLSPRQQLVFSAWASGKDLRAILSKTAFYKVRNQLIELCGVDISLPPTIQPNPTKPLRIDSPGWDPSPISELFFEPTNLSDVFIPKN